MIEKKRRQPYWRRTKLVLFMSLAVPFVLILAAPFFVKTLNVYQFLGFPLGYLITAHGVVLLAIHAVAGFITRQDTVDRRHGAHEDY